MQGKGSDKNDMKLSVLLALCILFALIAAGLISCGEKPKHKQQVLVPQYQEGELVYLKPDSTIGVIGDVNLYTRDIEYKIGYKNNQGEIQYQIFTETQIYSKK
jgi:hypothetical protein